MHVIRQTPAPLGVCFRSKDRDIVGLGVGEIECHCSDYKVVSLELCLVDIRQIVVRRVDIFVIPIDQGDGRHADYPLDKHQIVRRTKVWNKASVKTFTRSPCSNDRLRKWTRITAASISRDK